MRALAVLLVALVALALATNCPGGSSCTGTETCCKAKNGQYGCCPYANADCCSDGRHCCPNGYTCDLAKQECVKNGSVSAPAKQSLTIVMHLAQKKLPAGMVGTNCPGGGGSCTGTETCCKAKNGQYGCCPYANADCCSDGRHCCPNGYTCDLAKQECVKNGSVSAPAKQSLTIVMHLAQKKLPAGMVGTNCPGGGGSCTGTETCCKAKNGQYGCCPYANADCCSDGRHCCPNGYTCDLAKQECVKNGSVALSTLSASAPAPQTNCPGGGGSCTGTETCCKAKNGQYGCCPYANADCCSDGRHCCPNGYTCDLAKQECVKNGTASVVFAKMSEARPIPVIRRN